MPIDQELNTLLKEMWRLQEEETLTEEEIDFYNTHLDIIKNYYQDNNQYWQQQEKK